MKFYMIVSQDLDNENQKYILSMEPGEWNHLTWTAEQNSQGSLGDEIVVLSPVEKERVVRMIQGQAEEVKYNYIEDWQKAFAQKTNVRFVEVNVG